MDLEKHGRHEPGPGGQGCVFAVVRIPVRILAVVIVLPLRMAWDLLVLGARSVHRRALRPAGDALARLFSRLVRYVLAPVGHGLAWLARGTGLVLKWLALAVFYWPWAALGRYVLAPVGAALWRRLLVPLGQAVGWLAKALFVWPWVALWRYVLVPVAAALYRYLLRPAGGAVAWTLAAAYRYLLVPPARGIAWLARGLYQYVLTPAGRGLVRLARSAGAALGWLAKALFVWPWAALWRYVAVPAAVGTYRYLLTPLGHGVAWAARGLYRYVLTPLGHFVAAAWHLAGRVSRALGRGLLRLWRGLVARPAAWVRRHVLTPAGHLVREVWRSSRLAVREARASVRQALFGPPSREPARSRARTLGRTTAAGNTPAPEISLHERQG
ncbi:hypothetical protein [Streptomyces sp. NPDC048269]|uniref:hypothetical protein n=1 Tax=Streptomyces sp. NPDC048269 TaxID=3155753 RepID=UPI003448DD9E